MWQSNETHPTCKNTMAAETLALVDTAVASCWLSDLISELLCQTETSDRNVKTQLPAIS